MERDSSIAAIPQLQSSMLGTGKIILLFRKLCFAVIFEGIKSLRYGLIANRLTAVSVPLLHVSVLILKNQRQRVKIAV